MNKFEQNVGVKEWVKPELKRLDAGSAENLNVGSPDGSREPGTALS